MEMAPILARKVQCNMLVDTVSALVIWSAMVASIFSYEIFTAAFIPTVPGEFDHTFYFAIFIITCGSAWHAHYFRHEKDWKASVTASATWLAATSILFLLLFIYVMEKSYYELAEMILFSNRGSLGIQLILLAVLPLLFGLIYRFLSKHN